MMILVMDGGKFVALTLWCRTVWRCSRVCVQVDAENLNSVKKDLPQ